MQPSNASFKPASFSEQSGPPRMSKQNKYLNDLVKNRAETNAVAEKKTSLSQEQQANNQELQTVIANNQPSEKNDIRVSSQQDITKTVHDKAIEAHQIIISDLINHDKTGIPPLHNAILHNNLSFAKILLKNGASATPSITPPLKQSHAEVNELFNLKNNKTYPTIESLHAPIVNFAAHMLITVGDNAYPYIGYNAVTLAISTNQDIEFIKDLCIAGKKNDRFILNRRDGNGQTPLCLAIKEGKIELVNLLLSLDADPNIPDSKGEVPLNHAIKKESAELKLALVKSGAKCFYDGKFFPEYAYDTRDSTLLQIYKNYSAKNSNSVLKFIHSKLEEIANQSDTHFRDFLDFFLPVIDEDALNNIFFETASIPGNISKLMIIQDKFKNPFPEQYMQILRIKASKSGDPDQYEFAVNIDKKFIELLNKEQVPKILSHAELFRELQFAIAANNTKLVSIFLNKDKSLCTSLLWITFGEEAISKIADMKTDEPISNFMPLDNFKNKLLDKSLFGTKNLEEFIEVKTVHGFKKLLDAAGSAIDLLDNASKYRLVELAVKLKSTELLDILIKNGANINHYAVQFHTENNGSIYSLAMKNNDDEMVNYLISKGVHPTPNEIQEATYKNLSYKDSLSKLLLKLPFKN